MRRFAFLAVVLPVLLLLLLLLPAAATASVQGGCEVTGTSTSGGSVDLTTTDVWHLRSTDQVSFSGVAPSVQTQAALYAELLGLPIPLAGGAGEGDTSASSDGISIQWLSFVGRVFVISGASSGEAGGCSGQFTVVLDDVNPLLTGLGGGGAVTSVIGLFGSLAAVRRPERVRRLVLGMISTTLLLGGAALAFQQTWTPDAPAVTASSAFARSVVGPSEVSLDPAVIAQAFGLSVLLVILMPFPSELFNRTLEENADRIRSAVRRLPVVGRLARDATAAPAGGGLWQSIGALVVLLLGGLLYALLDPSFGTDAASGLSYLGIVAALLLVTWVAGLPQRAIHRRADGDRGRLHGMAGALVVAAGCVVVSRVAGFLPGYLYGLVIGYHFAKELDDQQETRTQALVAWWMLGVAAVSWVMLEATRSPGIAGTLPGLIGENLLAALVVAGIEGIVFGFVPLRFLHGEPVFRWRRGQWAALYLLGVFGFCWIILNPANGFLPDGPTAPFATTLGLFIGFGLLSVLFWGWFRLRPSPKGGEVAGES